MGAPTALIFNKQPSVSHTLDSSLQRELLIKQFISLMKRLLPPFERRWHGASRDGGLQKLFIYNSEK